MSLVIKLLTKLGEVGILLIVGSNSAAETNPEIRTMNTHPEILILGVNADKDTCDCCGKTGLKKVVWLEIDGAEPVAYGVNCAAMAKFGRPEKKGDDVAFWRMGRKAPKRNICIQPSALGV